MKFEFDAAAVELDNHSDFGPLPEGNYNVIITKSRVKSTNKGDGKNLEIEYTVLNHPEFSNRKVFDRITFDQSDPQKALNGRKIFKIFCVAIGLGNSKICDDQDFVGRELKIKIIIEKDNKHNKVERRYPA